MEMLGVRNIQIKREHFSLWVFKKFSKKAGLAQELKQYALSK
jgi:hypothetical protein